MPLMPYSLSSPSVPRSSNFNPMAGFLEFVQKRGEIIIQNAAKEVVKNDEVMLPVFGYLRRLIDDYIELFKGKALMLIPACLVLGVTVYMGHKIWSLRRPEKKYNDRLIGAYIAPHGIVFVVHYDVVMPHTTPYERAMRIMHPKQLIKRDPQSKRIWNW